MNSNEKQDVNPVLAICYDFDKTLTPDDMQAQGYIQHVGYDPKKFWEESNKMADDNNMDRNLAYMYKMMKEAVGNMVLSEAKLKEYGKKIKLFDGVEEWFDRINRYGKRVGVDVEHYIISSGLKEMIEGTKIAQKGVFKEIYASSFYFNDRGVAEWPAQVVNYTTKTQFLFRIEKGVLDINDPRVNNYYERKNLRVPFRNIVYIGDSETDIPCMKLVTLSGGSSIGVYDPMKVQKEKVYRMILDGRIKYFAPADYRNGKVLDSIVKEIIDKTAANEKLHRRYYNNCDEAKRETREVNE